jgi:hypothetical protein
MDAGRKLFGYRDDRPDVACPGDAGAAAPGSPAGGFWDGSPPGGTVFGSTNGRRLLPGPDGGADCAGGGVNPVTPSREDWAIV